MMKLIVAIFAISTASAQTVKTKGGDVITIKGKDTLVAFAGNWRVYKKQKKHEAVKKTITVAKLTKDEIFWEDVAIRKQQEWADKAIQIHGTSTIAIKPVVKKAVAKKPAVKKTIKK